MQLHHRLSCDPSCILQLGRCQLHFSWMPPLDLAEVYQTCSCCRLHTYLSSCLAAPRCSAAAACLKAGRPPCHYPQLWARQHWHLFSASPV